MKAKNQKIGALEKVSFFLANVGNIPLMSLLASFFTLFYTTIVGLDPAALGTLFLISKVMVQGPSIVSPSTTSPSTEPPMA